jgi:hypothetical protein
MRQNKIKLGLDQKDGVQKSLELYPQISLRTIRKVAKYFVNFA